MSSIKLTYFNVTALAEPTRWLLAQGDVKFEDVRMDKPTFVATLKPKLPKGQVPLLEVDGKQFTEHLAQARYAARRANLVGQDALEDMAIEEQVLTVCDLRMKVSVYAYETDEAIRATRKTPLKEEQWPRLMAYLENSAKANGGYLACSRLTWADVYFASLQPYIKHMMQDMYDIDTYPTLKALEEKVRALPAIAKFIAGAPKDMPF